MLRTVELLAAVRAARLVVKVGVLAISHLLPRDRVILAPFILLAGQVIQAAPVVARDLPASLTQIA
jgi:hypothetical protein